jgi:hypothetical protein
VQKLAHLLLQVVKIDLLGNKNLSGQGFGACIVLSDCGLVHSQKTGRIRTYQISPHALVAAEQWMVEQRHLWETRLNQLDSYLNQLKDKTDGSINSST